MTGVCRVLSLFVQLPTRGGTQRFNTTCKIGVSIQGQVHVIHGISNPSDQRQCFVRCT